MVMKLAEEPEFTNRVCFTPSHWLQACSNSITLGPLVKRSEVFRKSMRASLSSGRILLLSKIVIDPKSLQNAIAVQLSDIKVLSVDGVPEIDRPQKR